MDTPDDPADLLDTVALRSDLLDSLRAGPVAKRDLVDRVGVSRSTVDRGLDGLVAAGLATDGGNGYGLTVAGRISLDAYERALSTAADVQRAMPALSVLPPDAPVSPAFLDGCEVVLATDPAPGRPADRMAEHVRRADRIRALAFAHTAPEANELLRERLERGDVETTFVVERALYEYLAEDLGWTAPAGPDAPTMAVVDSVPYGLFLLREGDTRRACLLAYDREGNSLRALLVADDDDAVDWAEGVFERYRERATPVGGR